MALCFTSTEGSLRPIGELDLATVGEFRVAHLRFAKTSRRAVALDLSDLSFIRRRNRPCGDHRL